MAKYIQPQSREFFDLYSTENSAKTIYLMFNLISFMDYCKYNVMSEICFRNVGMGRQKTESCGAFKNTCLKHSTGKQVN